MTDNKDISTNIAQESQILTLEEFCQAIHAKKEIVITMVEYQLIQPQGETPDEWQFDAILLKRGKIAVSFYQDLEINMSGVALALELLDKIDELQQQVNILKKLVS